MDWDRLFDWLDNPILVKHVRSRLRRQPVVSSLVVIQTLCLCVLWAGFQLNIFITGGAFELLVLLQAIILIVMGSSQVSSAVNGARATGVLDFHRVSPLSPTELTLGFFFGAPIREYILFASTLPYAAICLAVGAPTFRGLVQMVILLLTTAWILQGLALLNALIAKPRANTRGAVGLVIFFLVMYINALRMGRFGPSAALLDGDLRSSFFGFSLPWLVVVLFFEAPLLFFIFIAASRKMESERLHPFTKPQASAALAILGFLTLGAIWRQGGYDLLEVGALYVLVIVAILLTITVTPSRAEYHKGLWRGANRAHPSALVERPRAQSRRCVPRLFPGPGERKHGLEPGRQGTIRVQLDGAGVPVGHRHRRARRRVFRARHAVFPASVRGARHDLLLSLLVRRLARAPGGWDDPGDGDCAHGQRGGKSSALELEPGGRNRHDRIGGPHRFHDRRDHRPGGRDHAAALICVPFQ